MNALGVIRVSTVDQDLGQEAQRHTLADECERRLWTLLDIHTDVISSRHERPELQRAIQRIEAGEAQALVVAKLDRLCRSTKEFCELLERSLDNGWTLHIADFGVDLTTPAGKMMARVLASFAEFERDMISLRTREALAELKAQGRHIGRPVILDPAIEARILNRHTQLGDTYRGIARQLNAEGIPTATGKQWAHSNVRAVIQRKTTATSSTPTPR